jgi:hypothetical protein
MGDMNMRQAIALVVGGVMLAAVAPRAEARVVSLVVEKRRPLADGKAFGTTGPYGRLDGTARFEVDPRDPLNAVIVNIDKAPRNSRGMVEFSAPFVILKPIDISKGNQKILYGINNRGNAIELPFQTLPVKSNNAPPDDHDGLFFRLGYTFVDAGWAGDITTTDTRLGANLPIAMRDGKPIVAPIRIEYIGTGHTLPLKGNALFRTYAVADTNPAHSTLTVREGIGGTRREVPRDAWAFGKCEKGRESLAASTTDLCVFDGFQPGRVYELTYPAQSPWVMGLGYAVTRDLASFLRSNTADDAGNPNPVAASASTVGVRRVYGLGISSTGMYMREFLYLGFNEDERHRKVFDAVRIFIPGTHRLFMNVEFSDPNVYSRQDDHHDFLSHSASPLTYAVTTDPMTGIRDGILKRPATDPLVFHVDTANEFWQMNASLNMHDGQGVPVPIPDNVRFYFVSSHSHVGAAGVGAMPTAANQCTYPMNGALSYNALLRALIVALDDWADRGIAPPPTRYPTIAAGTLVTRTEAEAAFPKIPSVRFPQALNELYAYDFGPELKPAGGRVRPAPPKKGARYESRIPKPDADGLDLGGVRTLDVAAPVGTNTGWNFWAPGPRDRDLCGLNGSFFPFARTKADRERSGDPRPSLEERYKDHAGFVAAMEKAARTLVADRFLLEDDAKTLIATAEASDVLR